MVSLAGLTVVLELSPSSRDWFVDRRWEWMGRSGLSGEVPPIRPDESMAFVGTDQRRIIAGR